MSALVDLARDVGVDERTLRRAVNEGTLRATRSSPRKLDLPLSERQYVRRAWPLIAALRAALRTEPNVRFALLYGSAATSEDAPDSDVDVLVSLRDPDLSKLIALEGRLTERVGRDVEVVRLEDAERDPVFFTLALEQGRALVDRVGIGPRLRRRAVGLARQEPRREARRARTAIDRIRALCAS
ncbi:MAG TPA: nucleotidyltransferase domain-containing protein [Conexibacter sp.]|nr:nucleotidyltransferase domain-containing protein [Conexibacter sp.]